MTRGSHEEVIPSAARLLSSMRDLGYSFDNAVADLIDNSISHAATQVDITLRFDGPDSWVRIADNGTGMTGNTISEAMRLGSGTQPYGRDDLGKFGLGLKTASLSQARCLTVASRSEPGRRQIECRRLDLDDVLVTDRWEIYRPEAADHEHKVVKPLRDHTGTVVVWTKLDRVVTLSDPFGGWAQRLMLKLAERLDLHLGMVFGRFLSGQAHRERPLTITLNGTQVEPWDPFCLDQNVEHLPQRDLRVNDGIVRYRPYVLPPQREFSSDEAWRRASGPKQWNRQQGFYIYRGDRMIQSGGWSWLRGVDEHLKLARAALEFWPDLDDAFGINVSKMSVRLPEELRSQLSGMVSLLTKRANDRYRSARGNRKPAGRGSQGGAATGRPPSGAPSATPATGTAPASGSASAAATPVSGNGALSAPTPVSSPPSDPTTTGNGRPHVPAGGDDTENVPSGYRVGSALERAAARVDATAALAQIREELTHRDPEIAHELGW